jgi:hypothetical protein
LKAFRIGFWQKTSWFGQVKPRLGASLITNYQSKRFAMTLKLEKHELALLGAVLAFVAVVKPLPDLPVIRWGCADLCRRQSLRNHRRSGIRGDSATRFRSQPQACRGELRGLASYRVTSGPSKKQGRIRLQVVR